MNNLKPPSPPEPPSLTRTESENYIYNPTLKAKCKFYQCYNCTAMFETKDEHPICPHCKTEMSGFKNLIFQNLRWYKIKPILLGLFFIINFIIWTLGWISLAKIISH